MKRGAYSVGAVYITICNNPRGVRFRREETILYCVIPGPTEPTTAQLNVILQPLIKDLRKLYGGMTSNLVFFLLTHPGHNHRRPIRNFG